MPPGLAAHGFDAVAYFTDGKAEVGSDSYAVAHAGGTYRFTSKAHLDQFKSDPDKYVPAYGGFCAYGAALGKKFDGDPRYWKIVDGKRTSPATSPKPTRIGLASTERRHIGSSHGARLRAPEPCPEPIPSER